MTADTPVTPDLTAEVAKVLAVALCREAHNDYGLVAIPDDPDPRLRIAACFQCQRRAAHVAAEVTNAVVTALEPLRALADEWEHESPAWSDPHEGAATELRLALSALGRPKARRVSGDNAGWVE